MALPWDVYATPIGARKYGRLAMEHGEVVVRPAFFRARGDLYGAVARASCPFVPDHDAPEIGCSCGFYAVASEAELDRLGADAPDLAVLDVELSGRVVEHAHGYRASHQVIRRVRLHQRCVRCGAHAELLHQRRFGSLVPACARCARRPVTVETAATSLGTTVEFEADDSVPAPRATRALVVLAQTLGPLAVIGGAIALATFWRPAIALALAQFLLLVWLAFRPNVVERLEKRLGIDGVERARLRRRWNAAVVAFTFGCAIAVGVASVALSSSVAS
ncbi:MAG TPA: hypothetical protein VFC99_09820 [Acidimicrobiia bacterium]|nr:hypothetical protein [Acidimicrobiia bacterium]